MPWSRTSCGQCSFSSKHIIYVLCLHVIYWFWHCIISELIQILQVCRENNHVSSPFFQKSHQRLVNYSSLHIWNIIANFQVWKMPCPLKQDANFVSLYRMFNFFLYRYRCENIHNKIVCSRLTHWSCAIFRFEKRGEYLSHVETSSHRRTLRNLQLWWNALHGLWIVSRTLFQSRYAVF